jgi:hypothetical protein
VGRPTKRTRSRPPRRRWRPCGRFAPFAVREFEQKWCCGKNDRVMDQPIGGGSNPAAPTNTKCLLYNWFIDDGAFGVSLIIADGDHPVTTLVDEAANMATRGVTLVCSFLDELTRPEQSPRSYAGCRSDGVHCYKHHRPWPPGPQHEPRGGPDFESLHPGRCVAPSRCRTRWSSATQVCRPIARLNSLSAFI